MLASQMTWAQLNVEHKTPGTVSNDRQASGLKASDFRVLEDGQAWRIRLFSAEDVPATIGLIMDNSGNMRTKRADPTGCSCVHRRQQSGR